MREELLNGEIFYTVKETQVLIVQADQVHCGHRLHSSLGYKPPAPETVLVDR